jgi:ubiquinone/menaquinone biosynthesis C-methylase UbiE
MESIFVKQLEQSTDYNSIALKYDIHERDAVTLWHLGYPNVVSYLDPVINKSVLDYGCGTGTFCRFLRERGAVVTGVDISEKMISLAKNNNSNDDITYYHINSGYLDFLPENSFDYVVSNFVLCTIPRPREIKKIMDSISRVLKKNGSYIILNPNWDKSNGKEFVSFKMQYARDLHSGKAVTSVIKTEPPIILNDYYWSKEDYCDLLTKAGFKIQGISEPVAIGNHVPWIAEKRFPPYYILSARK